MKSHNVSNPNTLLEFADNKRQYLAQSGQSLHSWNFALNRLCNALGPIANLPPKEIKKTDFLKEREELLHSGLAATTAKQYTRLVRKFLSELVPHGLNPECLSVFRVRDFGAAAPNPCQPALRSHLKAILDGLHRQQKTLQILVWMLLYGAPSLLDAVLVEFCCIDWQTGLVRRSCHTNGMTAVFAAPRPLLDLLKERQVTEGPNAVYVFPELIFTQAELSDPSCNWTRLDGSVQMTARRAFQKASALFKGFVDACGLPPTRVNYKSLRAHIISFWASLGTRPTTIAYVTGRQFELTTHYIVPIESEIERLREVTAQYLEAIRNYEPFVCPTTHYDLYEAMINELRVIHDAIAKLKRS